MKKVVKRTFQVLGVIVALLVIAFCALFYYIGIMAYHEDEEPTLIERQKSEITRLGGFISTYSPDDESYWARDEAQKQLNLVTGKDSDFYQDQAHIASAWSYVFYGMSYVPMCYHANAYNDLKRLSDNIVKLDSAHRYKEEELAAIQLKAMKAQAYYHHAQGLEDAYKLKMKMIKETESNNKKSSVRQQLMNNQVLYYKLMAQDVASMADHVGDDGINELKASADSIDHYSITNRRALEKLSENEFRSHLSKMMEANCNVLRVFNNGIANIIDDQKLLDKINSRNK